MRDAHRLGQQLKKTQLKKDNLYANPVQICTGFAQLKENLDPCSKALRILRRALPLKEVKKSATPCGLWGGAPQQPLDDRL
jgi:hypothetical protein